jgi:hypothetical protein
MIEKAMFGPFFDLISKWRALAFNHQKAAEELEFLNDTEEEILLHRESAYVYRACADDLSELVGPIPPEERDDSEF